MKQLLFVTLLLSGCANVAFDSLEYDRFVTIKTTIDKALPLCGKPELNQYVSDIHEILSHEKVYASYKSNNEQLSKSTFELSKIVDSINDKVVNNEDISAFYCKEKLSNISDGSIRIMETIGGF